MGNLMLLTHFCAFERKFKIVYALANREA